MKNTKQDISRKKLDAIKNKKQKEAEDVYKVFDKYHEKYSPFVNPSFWWDEKRPEKVTKIRLSNSSKPIMTID